MRAFVLAAPIHPRSVNRGARIQLWKNVLVLFNYDFDLLRELRELNSFEFFGFSASSRILSGPMFLVLRIGRLLVFVPHEGLIVVLKNNTILVQIRDEGPRKRN